VLFGSVFGFERVAENTLFNGRVDPLVDVWARSSLIGIGRIDSRIASRA